jgi:hypothetical protein
MTFKPSTWYPIAVALSVANLVALGLTGGLAEPWHAAAHGALALGFGWWAQRLRRAKGGGEAQLGGASDVRDRLDTLEDDVSRLRQELSETQERLDFTERMLAQAREAGRVGPQR